MDFFSILGAIITAYIMYVVAGYIMTSTVFFIILLGIRRVSCGYFQPFFDTKWSCFCLAFLWPKFIIWDFLICGIAKGSSKKRK